MSESAVSQQMKALEQTVGSRLLERAPHQPIDLTGAGKRLLATAETIRRQLDEALDDLARLKRAEDRNVVFGARRAFATHLLPTLYASIRRSHPDLDVRVDIGTQSSLRDDLVRGRIDLAVFVGPPACQDLCSALFAREHRVLLGPPGHRLSEPGSVPFDAIAREHLILGQEESEVEHIASKAREAGVRFRFGWEVGGVDARIHAARNGLGIALVPYFMAAPHLAAGTVALLHVEGFPVDVQFHVAWSPATVSEAACRLRQHLLTCRDQVEAASLCPAVT